MINIIYYTATVDITEEKGSIQQTSSDGFSHSRKCHYIKYLWCTYVVGIKCAYIDKMTIGTQKYAHTHRFTESA